MHGRGVQTGCGSFGLQTGCGPGGWNLSGRQGRGVGDGGVHTGSHVEESGLHDVSVGLQGTSPGLQPELG